MYKSIMIASNTLSCPLNYTVCYNTFILLHTIFVTFFFYLSIAIGFQPHANQFNPNVLNTLTYPKYADTRETEEPLITHRSSTSAR